MTGNEMDLLDSDHTSVIPDVTLIDARSSGKYGQEVMQSLRKNTHPLLLSFLLTIQKITILSKQ